MEKLTRVGGGNFSDLFGENLQRLNPRARRGYGIKAYLPLWGRWLPVGETDEVLVAKTRNGSSRAMRGYRIRD